MLYGCNRLAKYVIVLLGFSAYAVAEDARAETSTAAVSSTVSTTVREWWQSNLRTTYDFSSRAAFNRQDSFTTNVVGFDLHKVITGKHGDIATVILQPYIVNFSGRDRQPFFFDDRDTELIWRISNANFRVLGQGLLNFRVGHFELPFGLEQNIDTNGTLRQYSFFERGIKADWGFTVNGALQHLEYEFAVSRGSGNDITDRDQPYLFSGRIGTAAHKNRIIGLSFFNGEILRAQGTTREQRISVDIAWYHKQWELLAEASAGEKNNADTTFALFETSWRTKNESRHLYVQIKQQSVERELLPDKQATLVAGFNQSLSRNASISGQWSKPLNSIDVRPNSSTTMVQLRYRL